MEKIFVGLFLVLFTLATVGAQVLTRIIDVTNRGWETYQIIGEASMGIAILVACLALVVAVMIELY